MNACHYIWGAYGVTFLILVAMAIVTYRKYRNSSQ
ncbi:MAG: heme exporter protein CcmD [Alphaproteobacteria bacterium]|nr:heme exporter protein CcmD [Alphaproteobacteria bacterium]